MNTTNADIKLTEREFDILHLISYEFTTTQIARKLYLSPNTIETHRKNLFRKMDVKNAPGLIRKAFEHRILSIGQSVEQRFAV